MVIDLSTHTHFLKIKITISYKFKIIQSAQSISRQNAMTFKMYVSTGCQILTYSSHVKQVCIYRSVQITQECNLNFKCQRYYCIPWSYLCDGKWDCPDGQDESSEEFCGENRICNNMFHCRKSVLQHRMYVTVLKIVPLEMMRNFVRYSQYNAQVVVFV